MTKGREWLVIGIFAPDEAKMPRGYIPRDIAEQIIGRSMDGVQFFTQAESDRMRAHPEWRDERP